MKRAFLLVNYMNMSFLYTGENKHTQQISINKVLL
jgi:hypothetical protein